MQTGRPRTDRSLAVAAAVVVGVLVALTLRPDGTVNTDNLVPLRDHAHALGCVLRWCDDALGSLRFVVVDVAGNIVVFIPAGLVFAALANGTVRRRFWATAVIGFLLSLMIEVAKLAISTRASDVDDLIFNTLGTMAGAGIVLALEARRRTTAGP